ncbi:TPA: DNA cytosine methyltransferase [Bacillus cereus]|nr:DNA cytosine methyltransferase [Bacillus cereus]
MTLTFLDLFSGVGGFRFGMEQAGHKCLGYVEIDPHARKSYEAIHQTEGEWTAHDITKVSNKELQKFRGKIDVICGGFPCQAFSIAGKQLGFEDVRGTLFFEIARFAKEIQPRYLFLENVRNLLSHNQGETFATILSTLDELGYDVEWQLLNSKDIGERPVPQSRLRVFIVGHLRGSCTRKVFPIGYDRSTARIQRLGNVNPSGRGMSAMVYNPKGLAPSLTQSDHKAPKLIQVPKQQVQAILTPDRINKRQNGRRIKGVGEAMYTITAQDRHGGVIWSDKKNTKKDVCKS